MVQGLGGRLVCRLTLPSEARPWFFLLDDGLGKRADLPNNTAVGREASRAHGVLLFQLCLYCTNIERHRLRNF